MSSFISEQNPPPPGPLIPSDSNFESFQTTKMYVVKTDATQQTSLATLVTANGYAGTITTQNATVAAASTATFTVNNSAVSSNSSVILVITNYSGTYGTNGLPTVNVQTVAEGSFVVQIVNSHTTNALAGVLKISYMIV